MEEQHNTSIKKKCRGAREKYNDLRITQYYSNIKAGPQEIGARLYFVRKSIGLTLEEMTESMDLPRSTYRRCESGEVFPSIKVIIKLHEVHGVDIQWLLYGTHTLHTDILNGLAAASEEVKFDVFTRLYGYFIDKKFNCFNPSYSECQGVEHFARWDKNLYKPIETTPPENEIEFKNDIFIENDVIGFMKEYMPEEIKVLERAINLIKSQQ